MPMENQYVGRVSATEMPATAQGTGILGPSQVSRVVGDVPVERDPLVLKELEALQVQIKRLDHLVMTLGGRLCRVLTPVPPETAKNNPARPAASELAMIVTALGDAASAIGDELKRIMERLEV